MTCLENRYHLSIKALKRAISILDLKSLFIVQSNNQIMEMSNTSIEGGVREGWM